MVEGGARDGSMRRARPEEADALTALARRAKAHWDYPPDFLARVQADIQVTPHDLRAHEAWVLEVDGSVAGFHRLIPGDPAILEDLWLEPRFIGRGQGRVLWQHAVGVARRIGASAFELDADPNAMGFYERMGARQVGWTPSSVEEGRRLPRMRFELREVAGEEGFEPSVS